MDMVDIPSGNDQQFATQKMVIDIVDLPSYNMVISHSYELCQFTRGYLAIDGNITKGIQKDMQSPPMMDTCGVLFGMIELMTDPKGVWIHWGYGYEKSYMGRKTRLGTPPNLHLF